MPPRCLWPCAVLLVTAALCLLAGGLALYAGHAVLDERAFADRATSTLAQDEVQQEIADRIVDRLVAARPELAARRPVLDAAAADVVGAPAFPAEFHRGAAAMHHILFREPGQTVRFTLPGAGAELRRALRLRSGPASAHALQAQAPDLLALGGGRLETALRDGAPWARRLASLAPAALALGAVLLVFAVLRAPTRRRGLRRAALAVAMACGLTLAATAIARALVLSTFDTSHGDVVVATIWGAFLNDLRLAALAAGGIALALAAAAEPGAPGAWRRGLAWATHSGGPGRRLMRALALLLVAVLLLAAPEVPLDLALVALAGLLVFSAAAELVRLQSAPPPAD